MMSFKGICAILLIMNILLFFSGCMPDTKEVTDIPATENTLAYSEKEIKEIVKDTLLRGENANLLYLGEFDYDYNTPPMEGHEAVNMKQQYNALSSQADALKLLNGIKSTDDIKQCFYGAFTKQAADKFIGAVFGEAGNKYIFENNRLYVNVQIPMIPLSMGTWSREPTAVIKNTKDEIIVQLEIEFFLSGNKHTLPLSLKREDGIWLLDESFCPKEYVQQPIDRTNDEIRAILNDVITRGTKASIVYQASFDTIEPASNEGFALIDMSNQNRNLHSAQFTMSELVQSLKNTASVKQCFYDTFVPGVAEKYIGDLFNDDYVMYKDTDEGLAQNNMISSVQICPGLWQADAFTVLESSENNLMLLLRIDYPDFSVIRYRPIQIRKINEKWLLDQSFEGRCYKYFWNQ